MKPSRLSIQLLCSLLFLQLCLVPTARAAAGSTELVILTWSEFIAPAVISAFEQKNHVKIRLVYFTDDDQRDQLLVATEGTGYDLVVVNETQVPFYRDRGWLLPVTDRAVPNLKHVAPEWLERYADAKDYAVPYVWGTLGIAYRADLVPAAPASWMDLLRPAETLRGHIGMPASQREILGIALKALGFSINSSDSSEVAKAMDLLLAQQPFVRTYDTAVLNEQSELVKGNVSMSMAYSCDALLQKNYNDKIEYLVPAEGGILWVDYVTVLAKTRQARLAYAFLNFINEPAQAAKLAEFHQCSTANKDAVAVLSSAYRNDPIRNPTAATLAKSELIVSLPPRAMRDRNNQLARLRH